MSKVKLSIILAFVILFFLLINLDTKGYLLSSDIVDYNELDLLIEEIGAQSALSQEEVISDAIYYYFNNKALEEEAISRGFEVTDIELQRHTEQVIETMKTFGPEMMGNNFKAFLDEKGLTIEDYYREYQGGNRLKQQLLIQKLYLDIIDEQTKNMDAPKLLEQTMQSITDSYKEKHRFEIQKVKQHYSIK